MRPCAAYPLHLGTTTVYLSHDNYEIDWASFSFVAVDEAYAGDYRDAVVVDIGAHKGYYAAYALGHGARTVVSYEPETANFELLARAADLKRGEWQTRRSAVGAANGEAELHVMGASWGHALHPPEAFKKHEIGVEHVRVEALADVLADAIDLAHGARTIVKVNIEGEECPTILQTPSSAWGESTSFTWKPILGRPVGGRPRATHRSPRSRPRRELASLRPPDRPTLNGAAVFAPIHHLSDC